MTTKQPAYLVTDINGRFSHVRGKAAAITMAHAYAGAGRDGVPLKISERDLNSHYGISIQRVSAETARAVGL